LQDAFASRKSKQVNKGFIIWNSQIRDRLNLQYLPEFFSVPLDRKAMGIKMMLMFLFQMCPRLPATAFCFLCLQVAGFVSISSANAEEPKQQGAKSGQLQAEPSMVENVVAREPGLLENIQVSIGDAVKKGTILGHLDHHRQYHTLQVAKIRAADRSKIKELQAEVAMTQALLEDHQEQARRRRVSEHTVRQSEARAQASQAKLEAAKANQALSELALEEAQANYDRRFFVAPFDGVIVAIHKEKNETVSLGNPIFTIADHTNWVVRHSLPESIASTLKVGRTLPLYQAGSQIARFGRIAGIGPPEDGMQTVEFVVANPNPDQNTAPPSFEEPKHLPETPR